MARITRKKAQAAYDAGAPIMSDSEFDSAFAQNKGALGNPGNVPHCVPMLSQQKCRYFADLAEFCELMQAKGESCFFASLKLDGIAAAIEYENGRFVRASVRGDGLSGDDITAAVRKYVRNLPQEIAERGRIEVRGEIVLPLEFAAEIKTNPRNIAAGLCSRKTLSDSPYSLEFYAYDLMIGADERLKVQNLETFGFSVVPYVFFDGCALQSAFDAMKQKRLEFGAAADGIVIKCNSRSVQTRCGATKHHCRYSIAYKFQTKTAQSIVLGIEMGLKHPIAHIEPVFLDGALIKSISLDTADKMQSMQIVKGSKVIITRCGGVVPQIEKVIL